MGSIVYDFCFLRFELQGTGNKKAALVSQKPTLGFRKKRRIMAPSASASQENASKLGVRTLKVWVQGIGMGKGVASDSGEGGGIRHM